MSSILERHIQTVLAAVIVALLSWGGFTLTEVSLQTAVLAERVATLSVKVAALEQKVDKGTEDRYRAADARRDLALRDQRLQTLEQRLARLEAHPIHAAADKHP